MFVLICYSDIIIIEEVDLLYTFRQEALTEMKTEALLFGVFKNRSDAYQTLNQAFSGELETLFEAGDLSDELGSISKLHTFGKVAAKRIYFIGLGNQKELTKVSLQKAFGKAFKQLAKDHIKVATLSVDSLAGIPLSNAVAYEAIAEAGILSPFSLHTYHTEKNKEITELMELILVAENANGTQEILQALNIGATLGQGTNIARNLTNQPGNLLTASDLAEFAEGIANKHGFKINILEKEEMEALGMGALLAVNQGSTEPPKLIVMRYQGKDTWEDPIALVGKGITFDTGGYSLKPRDGMIGMKGDMGGAATTIGAMDVIGKLKPRVNVIAVIAATDNMISGQAFKPDDVIVSMSGKTIEVRNTDAEGRLVLADAITYAKRNGAGKIVDIATLTGGVIVALGNDVTGVMTNNEEWFEQVQEAADEAGELIWQLPYFDHYKKQVCTSHIADLNNSPGRAGHAIMAGAFLGEFAEDTPWVHLDIAGTANTESEHDLGPKGPTGAMTRTLVKLIMNESK